MNAYWLTLRDTLPKGGDLVSNLASVSVMRAVADFEEADGFQPTPAAYRAIADVLEQLAQSKCDQAFAETYHKVAELVRNHALQIAI